MNRESHHPLIITTQGFTIVELLVAMAISALLMVSLISIVSKSMDVSTRANAGMLSKSSAQAALDLMVTDLDSMVISRNAGEVFRFTNVPVTNAANLTNAVIYFLTTSAEDSYSTNNTGNAGVPRLVQYVIQYTTNFASQSSNTFGLFRNVLDPTNTFTNVMGSITPLDQSWSNNAAFTTNNYPLVPNVVGMNVAIYTNYGAGIWTNTTSSQPTNAISSTNFPRGVVLEISLTVLDEPALTRFGSGAGIGNNSATNLITQFGRTLVRRVSLPSPP